MGHVDERSEVLLVGGGIASVRCARTLRKEGFDGRILLVGDEATPPYNRPPLSKELLRDDLPDDLVLAEPERWYERRGVDLWTGVRVASLDLAARVASTADGRRIGFERCLLATGAAPRDLPVPGAEHARELRTLTDARALRRAAVGAGEDAPAVVIGGGFIGVEVASSLAALGLRPTILERAGQLWSGALGSLLAGWAVARFEEAGIVVRTGTEVTSLEPDAVRLGGERLPSALTVAGVGVRPRDELAARAGLEVADGIITDGAHRTSHPAVWSAGDVARVAGRRIEHWHAAREGGERAARSMLGLDLEPAQEPWTFTEVAGSAIDVVGSADGWDEEAWILPDRLAAFMEEGRVMQLASVGGAMAADEMRRLVGSRATVEEAASTASAGD
jgi:3-phenylpropionate/trans-cinnamate dioxygenase ferredoxin reductase subunit